MPGFFDKLKAGIEDIAADATAKSKEVIESQQVRMQIDELEGQKRKILTDLGEAVLAMYRNDSFDQQALSAQCQGAIAIDDQIKEKEAELEAIHQRAEAAVAEQHVATSASSNPVAAPVPMAASDAVATPSAGAFCTNCGAALEGAKFCRNCGTRAG